MRSLRTINVQKDINRCFYAILFILYVPDFISKSLNIPHWYMISTILIFISDIGLFLRHCKIRFSRIVVVLLLFYSYFVLTTFIMNYEYSMMAFIRMLRAISLFYLIDYLFSEYEAHIALDYIMFGIELLIYANFISMILFPNGLYHTITRGVFEETIKNEANFVRSSATRVHWLLGHQTTLIQFVIPAFVVALLYAKVKYNKIVVMRSGILMTICIIEAVIANSATNYIIIVAFFAIYLIQKFHIPIKWYFIISIAFVLYAIITNITDDAPILAWLSEQMGRQVKITTRITVWLSAIKNWLKYPIIGSGYIDENSVSVRMLLGRGNPHSDYLWILFEGGIVGVIFFIFIFLTLQRSMQTKSSIAYIVNSAIICFLIAMLSDDYIFRGQFFMIVFIICYNVPKLIENKRRCVCV